jgi:hypothetical protein
MFLVIQIAAGIVLAIAVLAWWREIGALALVVIGIALMVGVGSSMTWQDIAVVGALVVAAWIWRRRLLDWAGLGEAPSVAAIDELVASEAQDVRPEPRAPLPGSLRSLRRP